MGCLWLWTICKINQRSNGDDDKTSSLCHMCAKNVLNVSLFKVLQQAAVSLLHHPGVNMMVFPTIVIIIFVFVFLLYYYCSYHYYNFFHFLFFVYIFTVLADIVVVFVTRIQDSILYVACFSSFITHPGVVCLLCSEICFYIMVFPSLDSYAVVVSDV